ncbi:MAG: efflux transporter outer membrane subunit [Porticoccaceae bacterium]
MALSLAGCGSIGPDFKQPEVATPESWYSSDERFSSSRAVEPAWWTLFNDPVLNQLVDMAFRQNLPLQVAGLRIAESRARLGIALGNRYPQLQQLSGSVTNVELSENAPNFNPAADDDYTSLNLGFDAVWELDFWGRYRRAIESSQASLMVSEADYADLKVILAGEIARAYVSIRSLEERLSLVRANIVLQQESLRIATVRYENGATSELDKQQAASNLANTRALEPGILIAQRQALNALCVLLSISPGDISELLAGKVGIPSINSELATGVPADLLRRRPDVRRAEYLAASQSALIGVAKADLYPSFSLSGSIGYQASSAGSSTTEDLFDGDSLFYSAGPSLRWNIFNYGRLKNNVRVQDARFQQSLLGYRQTVLNAYREVEDAMVAFSQSRREAVFRSDSATAALRAVDIANTRYREGAVDFQRVIDSQRFLVTQQDQWTRARGEIALNLIAIYKALGGGWEVTSQPLLPDEVIDEMRQRTDWGELLTPHEP